MSSLGSVVFTRWAIALFPVLLLAHPNGEALAANPPAICSMTALNIASGASDGGYASIVSGSFGARADNTSAPS
ncbi:MAG: hypothetical protein H0V18_18690, partial [Pyrinomonadaceae bacterium]|nr:hypothetical protein [Pyrinomonadaceae bacterium]